MKPGKAHMSGEMPIGEGATTAGRAAPGVPCADDAVQMTVVALTQCGALCRDVAGVDQRVEIELVEPVGVGDRLLVRAGVAIANRRSDPDDRSPGI